MYTRMVVSAEPLQRVEGVCSSVAMLYTLDVWPTSILLKNDEAIHLSLREEKEEERKETGSEREKERISRNTWSSVGNTGVN